MSSFNLNIDEYSDTELKDLLSLNESYSLDELETSISKLRGLMSNNHEIDAEKKHQILFFLDSVYNKLKNNISINKSRRNLSTLENNITGTWSEDIVPTEEYGTNIIITDNNTIKGKQAEIIEHNNTNMIPPGYINPINIRTTKQIMTIDSRFRSRYNETNASNYTVELPDPQKKVTSLRLISAMIPFSYYSVSETLNNNTFIVEEIKDISGVSTYDASAWKVTLPNGNYIPSWINKKNGDDILEVINTSIESSQFGKWTNKLVDDDTSTNYIGDGWKPDITGIGDNSRYVYSEIPFLNYQVNIATGKSIFIITISPTQSDYDSSGFYGYKIHFNVNSDGTINNDLQLRLGWMLGFRNNLTLLSTNVDYYTAGPAININESEGTILMTNIKYGFLAVNDYKNNSSSGLIQCFSHGGFLDKNILARLDLETDKNENGLYTLSSDSIAKLVNYKRDFFGPVDINKLQLTLYDEYGRILELNNMDWVCSLEFTCLYS